MANNNTQNQRNTTPQGGSREQHAEAGRQSHKNDSTRSTPSNNRSSDNR